MNTRTLERFAQSARRQLQDQVAARLDRVLTTDSADLRARAAALTELKEQIRQGSKAAVIERVAYTWFNRFCALRYMDVNRYTRVGIVSPAATSPQGEAYTQPEILQEAKQGIIDADVEPFVDGPRVLGLLGGRIAAADAQSDAYRLLLVGACNAYHAIMPFLFEKIDDYTELLMPDDLLSASSILQAVRDAMTPEACESVEVIGWLYQFYISEKKDQVIGSKTKIKAADIPAATQLFTPHWIVRYLVENSLGRLWMLNRPNSRLVERMEYFISSQLSVDSSQLAEESGQFSVVSSQSAEDDSPLKTKNSKLTTDYCLLSSPEEIRLCDPAVGSGHMLTYAFDLLYAIYEEEGYAPAEIPRLILEKNLYGMEIDERAAALAAFALTMKARAQDRRFFRRTVHPNICVLRPIRISEQELAPDLDHLSRAVFSSQLSVASGQTTTTENSKLTTKNSLLHDLILFAEADNVGSLLRPRLRAGEIRAARAALDADAAGQMDWTRQDLRRRIGQALDQAEYLARSYHVVVANPPYMGGGNANDSLKQFAQDYYPDSKADLFAMFIERNLDLAQHNGMVAMITMQSWMFLPSFKQLREVLLRHNTILSMAHLGPRAFDTIGGEVVSTTAFIIGKFYWPKYKGSYIRLVTGNSEKDKEYAFRANIPSQNNPSPAKFYYASTNDFLMIPDSQIAYYADEWIKGLFSNSEQNIYDISISDGQTKTGDNDKFLRLLWEVSAENVGIDVRWRLHPKGGPFRRWYGNVEWLIDWSEEARQHYRKDRVARILPEYLWSKKGICWTNIVGDKFSFRTLESGQIFNLKAPTLYFTDDVNLFSVLGFVNSPIATKILRLINPTISLNLNEVRSLPIKADLMRSLDAGLYAQKCTSIASVDWDAYETAWDFTDLPLLRAEFRGDTLAATYAALRAHWRDNTLAMQRLETENNRIFIDAYGLQDELTPDVPLAEITLTCNPHYRYSSQSSVVSSQWERLGKQFPVVSRQLAEIAWSMASETPEAQRLGLEARLLADTMREFISYAVGCLFGRYSLDKPGLILANQGEGVEEYVRKVTGDWGLGTGDRGSGTGSNALDVQQAATSANPVPSPQSLIPDLDNVIPILDGDWFADDISERFKRFLRVTFGERHYSDNLAFIEAALGRDIRGYFLRDFYDDHVRRYQRRPIYWLFSSPRGSFNALIYMHRYRPDTVSVVLNNYLREFRAKLGVSKRQQSAISISAAAGPRQRTAALKEIDKIDKVLAELQVYEDEVLYPLATQQVQIDLDDGVKVNYNKLGVALKKITGLSE